MTAFRSLWAVLDRQSRRDFWLLALFSTVAGFLEAISVGLVIPFMAVATNAMPFGISKVFTDTLKGYMASIGIGEELYTPVLASIFILGLLLANATTAYYQYFSLKVVFQGKATLSSRLLREIISRPVGWFANQNSAELSKSVMSDVDRVVTSLNSLAQLMGILIRCTLIALFFFITQLKLAITLSIALGGSFYAVFHYIRRPLELAGARGLNALTRMYEIATEVFCGVREIKVMASETYFLKRFDEAAEACVQPEVVRGMPPHLTRMALETVTVSVVICVFVYFQQKDGSLANGLPIISAYAIAGIRLLPPLQQALFHWVQIKFLAPSVFHIEDLLKATSLTMPTALQNEISFKQQITFEDVEFAYDEAAPTLTSISFSIARNERVALVGPTGAGKSTLMDLILGLRNPRRGKILIDGEQLDASTIPAWLRKVGYVPQNIYLLDRTVAENIAFGVDIESIDMQKVEKACRTASIHDFIMELPLGYQSPIGERGTRLSGGQCQRLSIARALYHDPDVVLFDEATSALDNATEDAILKALNTLTGQKTLIVVAHRLNTVWNFENLIVLDRGKVVGSGRAEDLLNNCECFRSLALQNSEPDAGLTKVTVAV